ncbi:hypothetical protein HPU229334_00090 [Helicobacter pullorum]|uniref:Adenylyltransferase SoFic-like C-terminal domain-containing protein n=2 Tax=Helicobacter pullorum TaxID=35818 RepID=A0A0N0LUM3_9HELI|nr:hypothetical protein HPU229334_00090 [Helicobacter pullorum]
MHDDTIALITFYSIKKMLESLSNKDIKEAMNNYSETLKDNTKIYSKDLIDTLFAYPYTKIESLEKTLQITRQTSSKYLKICEELKLLECVNVQKKEILYQCKAF